MRSGRLCYLRTSAQELIEMKKQGKISKVSLALQVLQCNMFIDSKNELFYDDPYDTDVFVVDWSLKENDNRAAQHPAAAAVPTCQQTEIIITGETISELEYNAMLVFGGKGLASIPPLCEESIPCSLNSTLQTIMN